MSWFTKILGTAEVPGKVVDIAGESTKAILSGIDDFRFSEQEKSRAGLAGWALHLKHVAMTLGENTARSIARRDMAHAICKVFLFLVLASAAVWPFNVAYSDRLLVYIKIMAPYFGATMVFYFGPYMWKTYIKKEK